MSTVITTLPHPTDEHELARLKAAALLKKGEVENTTRTQLSNINHFRFTWGGLLPATASSVCLYIATYSEQHKVSTIRQRVQAISKWHKAHGFPDPTKSESVALTMRGLAREHQKPPKKAYPLTFKHLRAICDSLESQKLAAINAANPIEILRTHRDLALLLVGFWQGFRSDELSRIEVEHTQASLQSGLSIFLPHSKTDRAGNGKTYTINQIMIAYCPTAAYLAWLQVSGISAGAVFRGISRWGKLSDKGINKESIEYIINNAADGLFPHEPKFSTHSLRHGFADWAVNEGWDLKMLMDHVGWRSVENAVRYMPQRKNFGSMAISSNPNAYLEPQAQTGDVLVTSFQRLPANNR